MSEEETCRFPIVVEDENGLTGNVFYCTRRKNHPKDAHKIFIPTDYSEWARDSKQEQAREK